MCLAVPFKITEINEKEGIGERNGIRRSIRLDFIKEPKIGDYVIVHAGFAIERLPKEQAENACGAAAEVEEELRKIMEEMA
ncbi:MAG: HypC/HybG/HupF family hydrogenase formation chaperone [Lachnospiraceae bacterium]|nr:HypC/HybG/HupF family hydrogenase formation chaperone [Lachnospiraceae bacterium]